MPLPDELIMALADGELSPPIEARIGAAVRASDEARRKFDIFLSTRPLANAAFSSILTEPLPERLTRAVATLEGQARRR